MMSKTIGIGIALTILALILLVACGDGQEAPESPVVILSPTGEPAVNKPDLTPAIVKSLPTRSPPPPLVVTVPAGAGQGALETGVTGQNVVIETLDHLPPAAASLVQSLVDSGTVTETSPGYLTYDVNRDGVKDLVMVVIATGNGKNPSDGGVTIQALTIDQDGRIVSEFIDPEMAEVYGISSEVLEQLLGQ